MEINRTEIKRAEIKAGGQRSIVSHSVLGEFCPSEFQSCANFADVISPKLKRVAKIRRVFKLRHILSPHLESIRNGWVGEEISLDTQDKSGKRITSPTCLIRHGTQTWERFVEPREEILIRPQDQSRVNTRACGNTRLIRGLPEFQQVSALPLSF